MMVDDGEQPGISVFRQFHGRQPSGRKGAGVDADPMRQHNRLLGRRMAVDDHRAGLPGLMAISVPGPQEILLALLGEANAVSKSRMHENGAGQ